MDKPELLVSIDRERAAALGVDVTEIADTLRVAVGGDDRVSRYRDASVDDAYDVELRLVGIDRQDIESISQLYVRGNGLTGSGSQSVNGSGPRGGTDGQTDGGLGKGNDLVRLDNVVSFRLWQYAGTHRSA